MKNKYKNNFIHMDNVEPFPDTCGEIYELAATDNLSVAYVRLRKGEGRPHMHKVMDEIYFVAAGRGYLTLADEKYPLTKGQSVVIPKDIFHFIENKDDENLEILVSTTPKFNLRDVHEIE